MNKLKQLSVFQFCILTLGLVFVLVEVAKVQTQTSANTQQQLSNAIQLEQLLASNSLPSQKREDTKEVIAQSIKSAISADVTELPTYYVDDTGRLYGYNDLQLMNQRELSKRSHIVIMTDNLPERVKDYPLKLESGNKDKSVPIPFPESDYIESPFLNIEGFTINDLQPSEEMRGDHAYQLGGLLDCKQGGCKYTVNIE